LIDQHDPTAKLNDNAIEDLANTMDIDKDGFINFNEVKIIIIIIIIIITIMIIIINNFLNSFWKPFALCQTKLIFRIQ
jgi:hypothetical protein